VIWLIAGMVYTAGMIFMPILPITMIFAEREVIRLERKTRQGVPAGSPDKEKLQKGQQVDKTVEQFRFEQQGKKKSEHSPEKMCIVSHIVCLPFARWIGVKEIACSKQDPRNWDDGKQIQQFPGIKEDKGEKHCGNSSGGANGIVIIVILVFYESPSVGNDHATQVEQNKIEFAAISEKVISGKIVFNVSSKKVEHQHVYDQVRPAYVHESMGYQPVVLFPVYNLCGIEL